MKKRKHIARYFLTLIVALVIGVGVYNWNAKTVLGNQMPMPFGVGLSVVLSGSMEPALSVDDLVIVREAEPEDVRLGDIVVYQSGNSLVIHRVVGIEGEWLLLQGDANNAADEPIRRDAVKGALAYVIPGGGAVVRLFRQPVAVILILAAALLLIEWSYRKEKEQKTEELDDIRREIRELLDEIQKTE